MSICVLLFKRESSRIEIVSPFVKIRRLENRNEIGVFDALHLIVSHGTTRKQRQTYRCSSYSSSVNRRDFRIESLLAREVFFLRTHFIMKSKRNGKCKTREDELIKRFDD